MMIHNLLNVFRTKQKQKKKQQQQLMTPRVHLIKHFKKDISLSSDKQLKVIQIGGIYISGHPTLSKCIEHFV